MNDLASAPVEFNVEVDRRLRVAVVGCGGQAFRNVLPSFAYAPVQLVSTCDTVPERAERYASFFGAERWHRDYDELLSAEDLDAVFLVTGYDRDGRPLYPALAAKALRAGLHVWMEKPPAASSAEIVELLALSGAAGRQVAVGFMKMFSSAVTKVHELMRREDFGRPTTFYLRDPEKLPPLRDRHDLRAMTFFLDHIVHPASVMQRLMGPLDRIYVEEGPAGEALAALKFRSGAAGCLHLPWGQSGTSPMERLEVVGEGANVVVERNTEVTYYRPGTRGRGEYAYGRIPDFTTGDDEAPLHWAMDGYSGQPFNMHIFYQGYAHQIRYFCACVLSGRPVEIGGLADAWHVMRLFEAFREPSGQVVELGGDPGDLIART